MYFVVGGRLNLSWLHKQIGGLPADSHWQALAKAALRDEFSGLQRELTSLVLKLGPPARVPDALINEWEAENKSAFDRSRQLFADLQSAGDWMFRCCPSRSGAEKSGLKTIGALNLFSLTFVTVFGIGRNHKELKPRAGKSVVKFTRWALSAQQEALNLRRSVPSTRSRCKQNSSGQILYKSAPPAAACSLSVPSALICGSETLRTAIQRGALLPIRFATSPSTASPISDTSPSPCSL